MTKRKQSAIAITETIESENEPLNTSHGLVLAFASGNMLAVQVGDLPLNVLTKALLHGLKQKLADAAAMSRNPETGRSASIEDKEAAVRAVYTRLCVGEWNKVREGGAGASGGLLFRALCQIRPNKTPDDIRAFLAGMTDKQKAQLRTKNPEVVAAIAAIQAESIGDDGENPDDILAGLDGME